MRFRFIVEFVVAAVLATGIVWAAGERMELRRDTLPTETAQTAANYSTPAVEEIPVTRIAPPVETPEVPDEIEATETYTPESETLITPAEQTRGTKARDLVKTATVDKEKPKIETAPSGSGQDAIEVKRTDGNKNEESWLDRFWSGSLFESTEEAIEEAVRNANENGQTGETAEPSGTDETTEPAGGTSNGTEAGKPEPMDGGDVVQPRHSGGTKKPPKKTPEDKPVEVNPPTQPPTAGPVKIVIGLVGDIDIPESVKSRANGTLDLLAGVSTVRGRLDILAGDLRNQLTTTDPLPTVRPPDNSEEKKEFLKRDEPKWAAYLRKSGFTALSLANGRAMDYGWAGLNESIGALDGAGITPVGAGSTEDAARSPRFIAVKGKTIGFLAFSTILPTGYAASDGEPGIAAGRGNDLTRLGAVWANKLAGEVSAAKSKCDFLIVSYNWGRAGAARPDALAKDIAYTLADAGADVIFGHGTHTVQEIQVINGVPVAFSLGDFIWHTDKSTVMLEIVLVEENGKLTMRTVRSHECVIKDGLPSLTGKTSTIMGS